MQAAKLFEGSTYAQGNDMQRTISGRYFEQRIPQNGDGSKRSVVVLDLGCGDGATTRNTASVLAKRGYTGRIVGFDASDTQIDVAKGGPSSEHGFTFEYYTATFDTFRAHFPADLVGHVDFAVSSFAFHFCPSLRRTLDDVLAVLAPGGVLCAIYPSHRSFMSVVLEATRNDERFRSFFDGKQLNALHPNGAHIGNEADLQPFPQIVMARHHLSQSGYEIGNAHVADVAHTHVFPDVAAVRKFVAGINWMRPNIPEALRDEFDRVATEKMLTLPYFVAPLVQTVPCVEIFARKPL